MARGAPEKRGASDTYRQRYNRIVVEKHNSVWCNAKMTAFPSWRAVLLWNVFIASRFRFAHPESGTLVAKAH